MAEPLAIRWSRDLPSEPTSITITKDKASRYFISFRVRLCPQELPPRTKAVGLDLELAHAVITSDGQKIDNPRYYLSLWTERKPRYSFVCGWRFRLKEESPFFRGGRKSTVHVHRSRRLS